MTCENQGKFGPAARPVAGFDTYSMQVEDAAGERQAHACAFEVTVPRAPVKRFEDQVALFLRNARAIVADADPMCAIVGKHCHDFCAVIGCVFAGVVHEIEQGGPEQGFVSIDQQKVRMLGQCFQVDGNMVFRVVFLQLLFGQPPPIRPSKQGEQHRWSSETVSRLESGAQGHDPGQTA